MTFKGQGEFFLLKWIVLFNPGDRKPLEMNHLKNSQWGAAYEINSICYQTFEKS